MAYVGCLEASFDFREVVVRESGGADEIAEGKVLDKRKDFALERVGIRDLVGVSHRPFAEFAFAAAC
jgi:hypothetical protein